MTMAFPRHRGDLTGVTICLQFHLMPLDSLESSPNMKLKADVKFRCESSFDTVNHSEAGGFQKISVFGN